MERTWKEINETIVSENDLMSLTKSHNVSVYRRENFKNYESITYRCQAMVRICTTLKLFKHVTSNLLFL